MEEFKTSQLVMPVIVKTSEPPVLTPRNDDMKPALQTVIEEDFSDLISRMASVLLSLTCSLRCNSLAFYFIASPP